MRTIEITLKVPSNVMGFVTLLLPRIAAQLPLLGGSMMWRHVPVEEEPA